MLEGIKVVEMATYIAAPAAGGVMADWGAEVIKVEPLGGCPMRNFFATAMTDDYPDNPIFALDNRGKRALAVNTSTDEGTDIVRKLVADADVFLTNVRPGQLEKQGLDFETLHAINPKMIYASVTGFGLEGDERDKPGFDTAAFLGKIRHWLDDDPQRRLARSAAGCCGRPHHRHQHGKRHFGRAVAGTKNRQGYAGRKFTGTFRRLCRGFGFFDLYALWTHCPVAASR